MARVKGRPSAIGVTDQPTRIALLSIIERVEKRSRHELGVAAPTGTGVAGDLFTDTVGKRIWASDGAAWRFIASLATTSRSGVILTDAAQTLATATATDITWGTEVSDVDGWTSGGSATLTVPTGWGGRYAISYTGSWSASVVNYSTVAIYVNGVIEAVGYENATWNKSNAAIPVRTLAAGDTIKVQAFHNAGANRDLVSRLEVIWLGV